jgi:hypothetical protein
VTQLGRLEKVELRKVWEHEARDFSAWLSRSENLDLLGSQLGIEIELLGTEVEMGSFRVDVFAREPNTDEKIIIENQLEFTNHDHLGKVITYAAGLDARYLIWIVKDVRDEHLKAIEWLNEHLDETIRCFLVKIEVWQIGSSMPAARFDIVNMKNDWVTSVKKSAASTELSALKLRQQDFWQKFCAYVRQKDPHLNLQTPRPQHWFTLSIGNSLSHIAMTVNSQKNKFSSYLYITKDKDLHNYLIQREQEINTALGSPMLWWEGNVASGGGLDLTVSDIFDESKSEEYFEWLYSTSMRLRNVLVPYIQEYRATTN